MADIKVRDAITAKKQIVYERKPALYAKKCDGCGKVFLMEEFCNDDNLAVLKGTFDKSPAELGNVFLATACSFKCAHEIMYGKWRDMREYKAFKRIGAELGRCELKITPYVKEEAEIIAAWDSKKFNN